MVPHPTHSTGPMALFAVASLLLTFFVALTALSVRETDRARAVADGFAGQRVSASVSPISVAPAGGDMPAVRGVERRWGELFPEVAGAQAAPFGDGRALRGTIAAGEAFIEGVAELTPIAAARLDAVARLLAQPPADLGLALEAKLGVEPPLDTRATRLAALRARAVLHRLTAAQNPSAQGMSAAVDSDIAVGVGRGPPGSIDLELRLSWRARGPGAVQKPGG